MFISTVPELAIIFPLPSILSVQLAHESVKFVPVVIVISPDHTRLITGAVRSILRGLRDFL